MSDEQSFTMPSSPADRKKIKDALHEMAAQLQMIDDRRSAIKDIAELIAEEHEIPKKILMKMARTVHKHNYSDVVHETDVFTTVFETLFQESDDQTTTTEEEDSDTE